MFFVRFWGVRGSIACPSPLHVRYGGNTSCVEVAVGDRRLILDAGTGIRGLGKEFTKSDIKTTHLLLSHTHWDHIDGFPFFRPAFNPKGHLHVMAGHLKGRGGVEHALSLQMGEPMFPVPLRAMKAIVEFVDFEAGESFRPFPDVLVRSAPLNHPNGATGYRIEHAGKAICYVTDTEHVPGQADSNVLQLIEGADLVIYDSTFTEAEFPAHAGWGHSTWTEGVRLCRLAGVRRMAMFHHEPDHDDTFMDALAAEALAAWDQVIVAREGMQMPIA